MKSQTSRCTISVEDCTRKFANNLDLLVGHDDNHLFTKASPQAIEEAIQNFPVVDDDGNNFSIFSSIQKFQKFAPGVYLMFKLLRHLIFMFCCIGIISIIQMLILLKSPFYKGYENIVRINMLRLTIASLQVEDYDIYIVLDICNVLIICAFLIWWNEKLRTFANKCNQSNQLPSYLTVQLKHVSPTFSEDSLREYLITTEGITPHEIYTGRNYGRFLKHYKKLTETAIDLRVSLQLYLNEDQQVKRNTANRIIQKFLHLKDQYISIKSYKFNQKKYKPKEVFIVLKSYLERSKLLKSSNNAINLCTSSKRMVEGQQVQYAFKPCQVEPEAIAWENIGISLINYSIRALIVFLVLCIVTFMGIVVIFMLEILETASIGDAYHYHEENLHNLAQNESDSSQSDLCIGWSGNQPCHGIANYGKLAFLIMLTPLTIFVCKKLMMALLSHFVHFRKYPSEVSRIKSQTIILTIFYFIVIGALHLFLYLKTDNMGEQTLSLYEVLHPFIVKMFKITNYNPASIHLYSDYSLDWYKEATFFIIIICSTSFNISNGFKFIVNCISFKLQKRSASKQSTLYGARKALHGVDLHMEHIYASMIVINYFAYLYGCPIPVTVCFALVNLIFLFYTSKWTFIRYCAKPLRMGHSINRTATNLLFIGVIIHCIMAPIFLCAEGIGQNNAHYKYNIEHPQQNQLNSINLTIEQRYQKMGPYYLTIGSLVTVYFLFRKIFKNCIFERIKEKWLKDKFQSEISREMDHFGLYPSYSMYNNHEYGPILRNIYLLNRIQAKRMTCPLPFTLRNLQKVSDTDYESTKIFDEIQKINREYLDREKFKDMFDKVEEISRLLEMSSLQVQSYPSERATNDRIRMDSDLVDAVKEFEDE